jgi:protein-tyrosine phosphatase
LIALSMIDLHCHILPAVDDGAPTLEEAVGMGRLAATDGCTAMVATPHQRRGEWWNTDSTRLAAAAAHLQAALEGEIQILLGGEIRVDSELLQDLALLPPHGGILPLAGSRYLLLELSPGGTQREAEEVVHELTVLGWRPVLAHPELIPWLIAQNGAVARLVALGAATQVTAMSVTGEFGKLPQRAAWNLIEMGLAHFVASDSHSTTWRPPGLRRAFELIAERWGEPLASQLLIHNQEAVLADRPLLAALPHTESLISRAV